jgi:competence protein ComEC
VLATEHPIEYLKRPKVVVMKRISALLLFAYFIALQVATAQMRVHLINVGQGCATLIEFPCAAVLVDAGGEKNEQFDAVEALTAYLDSFFVHRPDLNSTLQCVYITHPHLDHTLGVKTILRRYTVKNAVTDGLENGSGKAGQIMLHRAAEEAEENDIPEDDMGFKAVTTSAISKSGLSNAVIDPVKCVPVDPRIKVLWGTSAVNPGWPRSAFEDENNHSLVIRFDYGKASLLITGDLEEKAQQALIAKFEGTGQLDADVYLVGHHGSSNGTTSKLLNKITPEMALIGVGDPDRRLKWTAWAYGHPNKEILDMLEQSVSASRSPIEIQAGEGAKNFVPYTVTKAIFATAWDGDVVLEADSAGNWKKLEEPLVPEPINVNTASALELQELPGLSVQKAKAIVNFRKHNGHFRKLEDLDKVPGIGPVTIELVGPYVKF